jgi:phosphohistidine phosphatase
MDLILWRHAQAEEGSPDHARELTAHGRKQAQRMGAWLDRALPSGCKILSSPTARTLQTVEALGRKYRIVDTIGPHASAYEVLHAAGWPDARGPVLVVGHQPWLGQVASLLLTGVEQEWTIKKSNAWWIAQRDRDEGNTIYLKAVLAPEFFID